MKRQRRPKRHKSGTEILKARSDSAKCPLGSCDDQPLSGESKIESDSDAGSFVDQLGYPTHNLD